MAAADGAFWLTVLRDGRPLDLVVEPRAGEWHGISLGYDGLGAPPRVCRNRCRFCFVDQVPAGLRAALSVKDDDYRLSFLHGNFTTLTNLDEDDLARIVRTASLAPVRVAARLGRRGPRPSDGTGRGRLSSRSRAARGGRPRAPPAGRLLPGLERRPGAGGDRGAHGRRARRGRPRDRAGVPGRRGRPAPRDAGRRRGGPRRGGRLAGPVSRGARRRLRARRRRVPPALRAHAAAERRPGAVRERHRHGGVVRGGGRRARERAPQGCRAPEAGRAAAAGRRRPHPVRFPGRTCRRGRRRDAHRGVRPAGARLPRGEPPLRAARDRHRSARRAGGAGRAPRRPARRRRVARRPARLPAGGARTRTLDDVGEAELAAACGGRLALAGSLRQAFATLSR